jgi:hypothetical protein
MTYYCTTHLKGVNVSCSQVCMYDTTDLGLDESLALFVSDFHTVLHSKSKTLGHGNWYR